MRWAAFVGVAVVAIMGVYAIQTALAGAGDLTQITEESFTPSAGTVQQLDRSNVDNAYYNQTVSVEDENGNPSYDGEDYVWFERNGTIKPLTGGNLDGDASATIDYEYRQTSDTQRQFAALLSQIPRVAGLIMPFLLILLAFAALRGL